MSTADYDFRVSWRDDGSFTQPNDDVNADIRPGVSISYGRDQSRALSPIATGDARFELNNLAKIYSPENSSSPLAGLINPARRFLGTASHAGVVYTLFQGHFDDYKINPDPAERKVTISATDALAKLREARGSTALYPALRTGEAINIVLDTIGWPAAARDLDAGASTVRWWSLDNQDAWTAIQDLVTAEGSPALITVDSVGRVVFKDRHHRLINELYPSMAEALNTNPGFEVENLPGWTAVGCTLTRSSAQTHEGAYSGRMVPDGVTSIVHIDTDALDISPGRTYIAAGWLRCDVTRSTSLSVNWLDSGQNYISTSSFTQTTTANIWTYFLAQFVAPSNAEYAKLSPTMTGTPAGSNILYADEVFLVSASKAIFRGGGTEPMFSKPLEHDHGWRDVFNTVAISVGERDPEVEISTVWSSDLTYTISSGSTITFVAKASDPFTGAITPVNGVDYQTRAGSASVSISQTSGQSTEISITASGATVIDSLQLRAYSVPVTRTGQVEMSEPTSIAQYGLKTWPYSSDIACLEDVRAVSGIAMTYRAERLPIVTMTIIGANDARLAQCLGRNLSDRITVIDDETGVDRDFYIEQITHRIPLGGLFHVTTFGCEAAPLPTDAPFTFDDATNGKFGTGKFAGPALDDPNTVFVFDHEVNGKFGTGRFAR